MSDRDALSSRCLPVRFIRLCAVRHLVLPGEETFRLAVERVPLSETFGPP
jgi:hypothetical protein